ncbi:hypothetical protein PIB30_002866 [Stylosanthes scabra]|uniref:Phosphopantothenoylcysteine decarboxylase n=1 Tax=Stylosanthes scabra TaxID=79078 RepID=A0ABU6T3X2_9FABA|nr:hypothetical protein [Stylosanthes scabra]
MARRVWPILTALISTLQDVDVDGQVATIVRGSSGNLLTSIVRAWDHSKPMFVATAMNTLMWRHPLTERHCISIDDLGINLIPPPARELADPQFISNTVKLSYDKKMQKQQGAI